MYRFKSVLQRAVGSVGRRKFHTLHGRVSIPAGRSASLPLACHVQGDLVWVYPSCGVSVDC